MQRLSTKLNFLKPISNQITYYAFNVNATTLNVDNDDINYHLAYNWYFPVSGETAYIEHIGSQWFLVMLYPENEIKAFADRPHYVAKNYNLEQLLNSWRSVFQSSPPESILMGATVDENGNKEIIRLGMQVSSPTMVNENTLVFYIELNTPMERADGLEITHPFLIINENYKVSHIKPKHIAKE
jgi:hypothetical protein